MVRSAAKNHARVTVVCDPARLRARRSRRSRRRGEVPRGDARGARGQGVRAHRRLRRGDQRLPLVARRHDGDRARAFPQYLTLPFERAYGLRYGENPHQAGAFYVERDARAGIARARREPRRGRQGALASTTSSTSTPRSTPCASSIGRRRWSSSTRTRAASRSRESLDDAYRDGARGRCAERVRRDRRAQPRGRRGDGAGCSPRRSSSASSPRRSAPRRSTCSAAKKNLRLLATGGWLGADHAALDVQARRRRPRRADARRDRGGRGDARARSRRKRAPTAEELRSARVRVARVQAREVERDRARAAGSGRSASAPGRCRASSRCRSRARRRGSSRSGSVLASDAFFPFPDGVEAAAKAGVTAVAQPGGSVKDADVIAAADA